MFESLLNPPSIGSFNASSLKEGHMYRRYEKLGADDGCTLRDVIYYLTQAAAFFEQMEAQAANQEQVMVCSITKANLLYIAQDHLTNHSDEPLNEAEERCIIQVMLFVHSLYQDTKANGVQIPKLETLHAQMMEVMDFFDLWRYFKDSDEQPATPPQSSTPQLHPTQEAVIEPYEPDEEIQRMIEELESTPDVSINTTIKPYDEKRDYYAELNKLIGLKGVKIALSKQIAAFQFQKERQKIHPDSEPTISFNCLFLGNPGTGKTTVARELAGILRREGLLKSGHYVEINAANIVSHFIGVSAKNAQLAVYKAIDGLLFIDEAYAIAGHEGSKGSATNDIIDALTPLLENYRDRLCVVLAGYGKEMMNMIESTNTGFSSRFQNTIQFENYDENELKEIFSLMITKDHYYMTPDTDARMAQVFQCFAQASSKIPTFANARTMRNLFEKIKSRMGERLLPLHQSGKKVDMDKIIVSDTELSDAEIWSVLGAVKQTADANPYTGSDYIAHLRQLLSLSPQSQPTTPQPSTTQQPATQDYQPDGRLHGIMMTDTKELAVKFFDTLGDTPVEREDGTIIKMPALDIVQNILLNYIQSMQTQGIDYTLLDISDDQYNDIFSQGRTWQNCLQILDRFSESHPETIGGGLFIVGGQDIIPSPVISNPSWMEDEQTEKEKSYRERNLEADLLYAYKSENIRFVKDIELDYEYLFNRTPRFAVGRLPMEDGVVSQERGDQILGYFDRAISAFAATQTKPTGIYIKNHLVTAAESLNLASHRMTEGLPLQSISEEPGLVEDNIFISPRLSLDEKITDIDELITHSNGGEKYVRALKQADMLTFATHGASSAQGDGCYGENKEKTQMYTAFIPELFEKCPAKVVSAICCWGARYINYRVEDSMLLTAMAKDVLIYMGSCRSALGIFDKDLIKNPNRPLGCANLLEPHFEHYLLQGYPAGIALHNAKMEQPTNSAGNLLTIFEFNLYGDPLLSLIPTIPANSNYKLTATQPTQQEKQFLADLKERTYEVEEVRDEGSMTLLERIRQRTNTNLMYIREKINKEVYAQYGLKPQELSSIITVKTRGKEEEYIFRYTRDMKYFEQRTFVHTDTKGAITSVYGTL